jgi:hypothetical protein
VDATLGGRRDEMSLIFKSSFGPGVSLSRPYVDRGYVSADNHWSRDIVGGDQGFDWQRDLPQREGLVNRITTAVRGIHPSAAPYVDCKIEDGKLKAVLLKQDPLNKTGTRFQYSIFAPPEWTQAYGRFGCEMQPDLATAILPPGEAGSVQFMEWRESGDDFRLEIFTVRSSSKPDLFWRTRGQLGAKHDSPKAWPDIESKVPVPVGKRFVFEVFWKLHETDGRLWAAVDGEAIVDFRGQTKKDSPLNLWWPFKIYVGSNLPDYGEQPIYRTYDDFEIHTDPPSTVGE